MTTLTKIGCIGVPIACVVAVYVVGCQTGIGPYDLPPMARKADAVYAEAKRIGLPTTSAEVLVPIPGEDARAEVLSASRALSEALAGANGSTPDERLRLVAQERSGVLDKVVAALETKPGWEPALNWDKGVFLLFPEYAQFKGTAKLLARRAEIRAKQGEPASAVRDLKAIRTLSGRLCTESTLISALVGIALDQIGLRAAERCATELDGDAEGLELLRSEVARPHDAIGIEASVRGEFYLYLFSFRNLSTIGGVGARAGAATGTPPPPSALVRDGVPSGMFERASFADIGQRFIEAAKAIRAKPGDLQWARDLADVGPPTASNMYAQDMLEVYRQAADQVGRVRAQRRVCEAGIGVLEFRARTGKTPATLAEAKADFEDPLRVGEKMKAILEKDRIVVWSVGLNGEDEKGGTVRDPAKRPDDLAFFYPSKSRP
ncbi:MAG: hypothetical protein IT207_05905 [Fimbriimonadaceae bacterium]|nr:hypothetical protein [Fimbriimonadaceae bacterium]